MVMLATIGGISLLIILHELGHLLVARACGMRVLRFSIGFGPTVLAVRAGGIVWQLAAVPMGGYVLIDGMAGDAGSDEAVQPDQGAAAATLLGGKFADKPVWQRLAVIFAGPASNWLLSAALLVGLAATSGLSHIDMSGRLGELAEGGAAAQAGLQAGDQVERIDSMDISAWEQVVAQVRSHPGSPLQFVVRREGQLLERTVVPSKAASGGVIGVAPFSARQVVAPHLSLQAGVAATWAQTVQQVQLLRGMITGSGSGQLTGLPGMVKAVSAQAARAPSRLFEQLASISIGLCLLNLMPIPALDGGRLLFLLLEWVRRRPIDERLEGLVHTAGFVLLLGVMVFVSLRDLL